jgi:hypothetical protein
VARGVLLLGLRIGPSIPHRAEAGTSVPAGVEHCHAATPSRFSRSIPVIRTVLGRRRIEQLARFALGLALSVLGERESGTAISPAQGVKFARRNTSSGVRSVPTSCGALRSCGLSRVVEQI